MIDEYLLMHKNVQCGLIAINRDDGTIAEFSPENKKYIPFLGNSDRKNINTWWKYRAVPGSRRDMQEVIRRAGCETNYEYLAKNLALSITDTYWICPIDLVLSWEEVNLHRLAEMKHDVVVFHNATSYDPNASLGGQMNKYWDMRGETPVLTKIGYESFGQQSVNEFFATEVHSRQAADIPFVTYYAKASDDNAILSCCDAFTTDIIEFIPAYQVLRSRKLKSNRSDCDQFIDICEENGINREVMQRFVDYMILTDFAISNTDRHLQNFGILRNADTMELIGPAPLFDSGNSMFYKDKALRPLSRVELLDRKISSFHEAEEKMLKHVADRSVIDMSRLPSADEVKEFYISYGIPEEKAGFIAGSYSNKLGMLHDFQKGISISLYHEKQKQKKEK